jgi:nitrite reductase/ring-hydroxylating ferredoxin subunit/uncharacterized membrane protein
VKTAALLEKAVQRIEAAEQLDGISSLLSKAVRPVIRPGVIEDSLSGTGLAHPVHPMLVTVPIGAWALVPFLDAMGETTAARRLTGVGCIAALPTAASGAADWLSTQGAERRVGIVHALLNYTALGVQLASWRARVRGRVGVGVALSLVGAGVLTASGWLGGHLTYAQGVGVDTTVFEKLPTEWTDVAAEAGLPPEGSVAKADVDGVPILLARRDGRIVALAARCTHRGGPLHEGEVRDGCVVCPWHGSAFSLDDGAVASGPATRPQPTLDTRITGGRIEVRRAEERTLRTNPTGV